MDILLRILLSIVVVTTIRKKVSINLEATYSWKFATSF